MPTSAATPCFPLADTWWLPRLQRLAPPPVDTMAGSAVAEAAPLYGAAPALFPGFCATLAESGRQAALCLLPDGQTLLLLEYSFLTAAQHSTQRASETAPASWAFSNPNGIFCFTQNGGFRFTPPESAGEFMDLRSTWVNLDDSYGLLGIYGGESFQVARTPDKEGFNRDEFHWRTGTSSSEGTIDRGSALIANCPVKEQNDIFRDGELLRLKGCCSGPVRAIHATGRNGRLYIFATCFAVAGQNEGQLTLPPGHWLCLTGGLPAPQDEATGEIRLRPGESQLWMEGATNHE